MKLLPIPGILAGLLLAAAAAASADEEKQPTARPPERPVPVQTAAVTSDALADGRTFVGSVEASRRSLVGSEFAGLVAEYLVHEGDFVKRDQPLARLSTTILGKRLAAARAEHLLRDKEHLELKNGSRPEEVAEARARQDEARAQIDLRRWKLEAAQRLYESRTISQDELRDAELALRAAEERLKETQAALALVEAGPREERIEQAWARVLAQQAEVERLEEEERRCTVLAPFEGYVVAEHTEVGQWLAVGSPVAEVEALDVVDVVVPVLEDFVGGLREGTPVTVQIGALPGRLFTGAIHKIVPKANERARTFPVKIRVANEIAPQGPLLKAGMFARATLAVGEEVQALLVPKDAIVLGGPQAMVYAVDPDTSRVRPVPVELGIAQDGLIQVRGELEVGTKVVTRGNERLRPGQLVADAAATGEPR